ncbi:MAG: tetratricopeptide repeat protein [Candidatus Acidiferrum sp.]|jgi:TolB-like protein/DNA-binding winged helix-turn-helix (wHTH) protein/Flp pilus assembly protein TadD
MLEHDRVDGQLRFSVFELDLRAGELRKRGLKIRLQEQPFRVLATLVERAGEVVTREELQKKLWPADTFVDFDHGLNKAINKIREALGDSAESPRFVETVSRRGYRFLAEVKDSSPPITRRRDLTSESGPPAESLLFPDFPPKETTSKHRPLSWMWKSLTLMLVVMAASVAAWKVYSWKHPTLVIRSLAVLPLESLSSDASQDYFADGMTDELISDLGQISSLRVISRTSVMGYKHAHKPLPQIARELNVDAVVEGTVLRSGDQVRITAQLIEAAADKHLWSRSYEGELRNTLALQNQVASAIADQIRINLNPQEQAALKTAKVVDPEAYQSYLKGRFFWNRRTADGLRAALAYFNQAIEEDPKYAQAYSGLADTYALLGDWQYGVMTTKEALPRAKAAAVKALKLDGTLGEAHNSLAFCLDGFDWDLESGGKEFRRAIELNPGYATAHHWYAWHLALLRQYDEAIAEMKKAQNLDPLSLIIDADLAELLVLARSYDESIVQSRNAIEMDPNFALAHNQLGQAYLQERLYEEAIAELQKAVQLSGGSSNCMANLARAYAASGKRSKAEELLRDLKKRSNPSYSQASEIAVVYVALGDTDQAMNWLRKGYEERFNPGVLIRPGFDPLRTDPRFQDLVDRIGLPH